MGERRAVGFGFDDFHVKEIDRDTANDIIIKNHYSGKFYSASYIHLGVFSGGVLSGVLQFGHAMNPASYSSVCSGTKKNEYLELNRMWISDDLPRNSESRAVSCAIKYLRQAWPAIKWIQSFADERCGRGGVVYQACNFRFYGEHVSTFWELDGVFYHNSQMTRAPEQRKGAAFLQSNRDKATPHEFRQWRYIYFMKPRFALLCKFPAQTPPKFYAARPEDEQSPDCARQVQPLRAAPVAGDGVSEAVDLGPLFGIVATE